MYKATCVLITFNPDISYFKKVISSIQSNNVSLIVVDNGSSNYAQFPLELLEDSTLIPLGQNVGIAKAQNIGMKTAFDQGATHVWLSDQDTLYPETYTSQMFHIINELESEGHRYGAIGPSFFELQRKQIEPFFRFKPKMGAFQPCKGLNPVSHIIASGMIIPKNAYLSVGPKREDLFIDWVDLEWCWRSNSKGYAVYGTGDVKIEHILGDRIVRFMNREVSIRSPFRHYFMVRNGLFLCLHDKLLPLKPRLFFLKMAVQMIILYPLIAPENKLQHLKANLLGCYHGVFKRLGPKP